MKYIKRSLVDKRQTSDCNSIVEILGKKPGFYDTSLT
jgi:hypothetical protein